MKKWIAVLLVVIVAAAGVWYWKSGQSSKSQGPSNQNPEVNLINPVGPAVIPVIALDKGKVTGEVTPRVKYWKNNDEVVAMLSKGDADFAVVPLTQAANLYAKQKDLVLLGVHEWKVFYLVGSQNTSFNGWKSMKGKTIYTPPSRGQTVDVLMRAAMAQEGLNPDEDVKIFYAPPPEIVALFQSGKIDYAALPEPYATAAIASDKGKIVLDFQKFWSQLTGGAERIPVAGLFVKKAYMDAHPNETKAVEKLLIDSTNWGNQNVDQAVELSQELIATTPAIMKSALQRIDFHYVPSREAKPEVELFLNKMKELYGQGITAIPDAGFYAS